MSGDLEHAGGAGPVQRGTFPEEWGTPHGAAYSIERAAWVRDQVLRHRPIAEFRKRRLAARASLTRLAVILAKRYAPGDEPTGR